jgi:hypothetical protein
MMDTIDSHGALSARNGDLVVIAVLAPNGNLSDVVEQVRVPIDRDGEFVVYVTTPDHPMPPRRGVHVSTVLTIDVIPGQ